jgi:hypothetical protein
MTLGAGRLLWSVHGRSPGTYPRAQRLMLKAVSGERSGRRMCAGQWSCPAVAPSSAPPPPPPLQKVVMGCGALAPTLWLMVASPKSTGCILAGRLSGGGQMSLEWRAIHAIRRCQPWRYCLIEWANRPHGWR